MREINEFIDYYCNGFIELSFKLIYPKYSTNNKRLEAFTDSALLRGFSFVRELSFRSTINVERDLWVVFISK